MKNKDYGSNDRKRGVGKMIALIVACVLVLGCIISGFAYCQRNETEGKIGLFAKELNEDNLIKHENYFTALPDEAECGLKMDWKDDGSVVLSGKVKNNNLAPSLDYYKSAFVSVDLAPGVYTLSTGNAKCDEQTYGLYYQYMDHNSIIQSGYVGSEASVIDLSSAKSDTALIVSIFAKEDVRLWGIQSKICPTLVSGKTAGEFYK